MSETYFSVQDVRKRYAVSEGTVLNWIRRGDLKAINCGVQPGRLKPRWRITAESLSEFEAARQSVPADPPRRRRRKRETASAGGMKKFYD